jgi:cyclic pyranopterin phosphate synthase
MGRAPLVDGHGRRIGDLRVSVTDRCNFRCQYCMPADGLDWLAREEVLRFEEIERLVRLLVEMGVADVRLTGGEPLVRRDFPQLAGMLAAIPGLRDLSLTTNGYLLERDAGALAEAGVNRLNVSIDSLQRDRFFEITRRDALPRVLRGLEAAAAEPRLRPIKVNAVALRGFSEEEALPFARLARERGFEVRFIEFMPLDGDSAWTADQVLTGEELRAIIHAQYPLVEEPRAPSATARVFRFEDAGSGVPAARGGGGASGEGRAAGAPGLGDDASASAQGRIGFINPVSEPFCSDCNRIRLTSDGRLRTCLFSLGETDLRGPLRAGASDDDLEEIIRAAVWRKELKHHVGEPGFQQPARTMSAIGG